MKRSILALVTAAVFAGSAGAITNGVPDGDAHPYVGAASSGHWGCSGTLLSPTVFLTAGHCTDLFASTGESTYVTVDPNAGPSSVYVTGTPYTEPGFFNIAPQGVGVPASIGNDLGVIVLDQPIQLSSYGQLPGAGSLTGPGVALTAVGYGAQDWMPAPHGHVPLYTFVRTRADVSLINDANAVGDEFARLSTNPGGGKGGLGPGDSGAPAFFAGTSTIAAIGSHVTNPNGAGTAYFSRLDAAAALAFITPFLGS